MKTSRNTSYTKFLCQICDKRFNVLFSLNDHIKSKHNKSEPKDPDDNWDQAVIEEIMKPDMSFEKSEKPNYSSKRNVSCEFCDKQLKTFEGLEFHLREKHIINSTESQENTSSKRKKIDSDRSRLSKKEVLYIPDPLIKYCETYKLELGFCLCKICDETNETYHSHKAHYITKHLKIREEPDHCEIQKCNQKLWDINDYKNHLYKKHDGAVRCELCDMILCDRMLLVKHQQSHTVMNCVFCGKLFAHRYQLKEHQATTKCWLTIKLEGEFQCIICREYFNERHDLEEHLSTNHLDPFETVVEKNDNLLQDEEVNDDFVFHY